MKYTTLIPAETIASAMQDSFVSYNVTLADETIMKMRDVFAKLLTDSKGLLLDIGNMPYDSDTCEYVAHSMLDSACRLLEKVASDHRRYFDMTGESMSNMIAKVNFGAVAEDILNSYQDGVPYCYFGEEDMAPVTESVEDKFSVKSYELKYCTMKHYYRDEALVYIEMVEEAA